MAGQAHEYILRSCCTNELQLVIAFETIVNHCLWEMRNEVWQHCIDFFYNVKMVDASVEVCLKVRSGKKWKQRRCWLKKLSPVADCIHVYLCKDHNSSLRRSSVGTFSRTLSLADSTNGSQSVEAVPLEDFFGIECDFELDRERFVMSLVYRQCILTLAFHNKETLEGLKNFIRKHLGDEYRFDVELVKAPATLRLPVGNNGSPVRSMSLFIRGKRLCLVSRGGQSGQEPFYLASWNVCDLRRFGIQNNYFCFDATNSQAAGLYALSTSYAAEINRRLKVAVSSSTVQNSPLLGSLNHRMTGSQRSLQESVLRDMFVRSPANVTSSHSFVLDANETAAGISPLQNGFEGCAVAASPNERISTLAAIPPSGAAVRRDAEYYNIGLNGPQSATVLASIGVNCNQRTKSTTSESSDVQSKNNGDLYYNIASFDFGQRQKLGESERASAAESKSFTACTNKSIFMVPKRPDVKQRKWFSCREIQSKHSAFAKVSLKRLSKSCSDIEMHFTDEKSVCNDHESKSAAMEYININDVCSGASVLARPSVLPPSAVMKSASVLNAPGSISGGARHAVPPRSSNQGKGLPYVDLERFDGTTNDDGYLYFRAGEEYMAPKSGNYTSGSVAKVVPYKSGTSHQRSLGESNNLGVARGRHSTDPVNQLLNCVPPPPPKAEQSSSYRSASKQLPYVPPRHNNVATSSESDGPVMCPVEFPRNSRGSAGQLRNCRVMSASDAEHRGNHGYGYVSKPTPAARLAEPDYLDMSRDHILGLRQHSSVYTETKQKPDARVIPARPNADYMPMYAGSKAIGGINRDSGMLLSDIKSSRLVKSHSAEGLIDQTDSETGSENTDTVSKAPTGLMSKIFGSSRKKLANAVHSDSIDNDSQKSLLNSSASSLVPDVLSVSPCPVEFSEIGVTYTENALSDYINSELLHQNSRIFTDEPAPPPLPEKQKQACSLNMVPPVPPRPTPEFGNSVNSTSSLQRPKVSRKPDLTVDIPKTCASLLASHDVQLAHYRPELFTSTLSKLDSPAWSTSTATTSWRSRRSVQSELPTRRTTSNATTTLRPRYGKEYHLIDRSRLMSSDDSSPLLTGTPPTQSPLSAASRNTSATVFTFDTPRSLAMISGSRSEENSPKVLANVGARSYVNVNLTPPPPPPAIDLEAILQQPAAYESPLVNYTDLDLATSGSSSLTETTPTGKSSRSQRTQEPPTEYAQIDLVATAAASEARRMHERERQDTHERISERRDAAAEQVASLTVTDLRPSFLARKGSATVMSSAPTMERRIVEPKRAASVMVHGTHGRRHSPPRPPPPPPPDQPS